MALRPDLLQRWGEQPHRLLALPLLIARLPACLHAVVSAAGRSGRFGTPGNREWLSTIFQLNNMSIVYHCWTGYSRLQDKLGRIAQESLAANGGRLRPCDVVTLSSTADADAFVASAPAC